MTIKNIIFDLGGVILNLDYDRTIKAFEKLGAREINTIYNEAKQDTLFEAFETGKITSNEFRQKLTKKLGFCVNETTFDEAWNAMLLNLPDEHLSFLRELKNKYRVLLFSNTNEIHYHAFQAILKKENQTVHFSESFHHEFYSHILGMRKPDVAAFHEILRQHNLDAKETVFIDDSLKNVEGALDAGLHAIHFTKEMILADIMQHIKQIDEALLNEANHTQCKNKCKF